MVHVDRRITIHGGFQCRLVYHVLQIGAGTAGRAASHLVNVDVRRDFHFAHVVVENVMTTFEIGRKHLDFDVKSTRTQQRSAHKSYIKCSLLQLF